MVKIGGSTLGSHDTTIEDLVTLQKKGLSPVVVHGGGQTVSQWLGRLGISTMFVRGKRVTDMDSLSVVVAVLAGLVNKELVAAINALGGRAAGLSGIDGCLIEAGIADPELGYVGDITNINLELLDSVKAAGYIPVIAPVGYYRTDSSDDVRFLNVNADTAAGAVAAALGAESLVFLTDVAGICDGSGVLIPGLSKEEARGLIADGVVDGGMIPKVEACLVALSSVSVTRIIDGRAEHALLNEVEGSNEGTTIK